MDFENNRIPGNKDVDAALQLFLALHETPTKVAAENLIVWLQKGPAHVQALDKALTVWALAGAALIGYRSNSDEKEIH